MSNRKEDAFDKYFREKSYQKDTNYVLRNIDRQYDKICSKIKTSKVVQGVSAAVFGITGIALAGHSDFIDEFGLNVDIFAEPASQLAMGVCAVSALAFFVANKIKGNNIYKAERMERAYNFFDEKLLDSEEITSQMEKNGDLIPSDDHANYAKEFMSRVNKYYDELGEKDDNNQAVSAQPEEDELDIPDFMKQSFSQDDGQGQ